MLTFALLLSITFEISGFLFHNASNFWIVQKDGKDEVRILCFNEKWKCCSCWSLKLNWRKNGMNSCVYESFCGENGPESCSSAFNFHKNLNNNLFNHLQFAYEKYISRISLISGFVQKNVEFVKISYGTIFGIKKPLF